jgi:hypothetical protein
MTNQRGGLTAPVVDLALVRQAVLGTIRSRARLMAAPTITGFQRVWMMASSSCDRRSRMRPIRWNQCYCDRLQNGGWQFGQQPLSA